MRDTVTCHYNRSKEKLRFGTTLNNETDQEAQENYHDGEDMREEYSGIDDIKHGFH